MFSRDCFVQWEAKGGGVTEPIFHIILSHCFCNFMAVSPKIKKALFSSHAHLEHSKILAKRTWGLTGKCSKKILLTGFEVLRHEFGCVSQTEHVRVWKDHRRAEEQGQCQIRSWTVWRSTENGGWGIWLLRPYIQQPVYVDSSYTKGLFTRNVTAILSVKVQHCANGDWHFYEKSGLHTHYVHQSVCQEDQRYCPKIGDSTPTQGCMWKCTNLWDHNCRWQMTLHSIVTARKRSLWLGNIFTSVCHSVHRGGLVGGGRGGFCIQGGVGQVHNGHFKLQFLNDVDEVCPWHLATNMHEYHSLLARQLRRLRLLLCFLK